MKPEFQADWIDLRVKKTLNGGVKATQLRLCQAAALRDRWALVNKLALPKYRHQQVMTFHGPRDPSSNRNIRYIYDVTTFGDSLQIVVSCLQCIRFCVRIDELGVNRDSTL